MQVPVANRLWRARYVVAMLALAVWMASVAPIYPHTPSYWDNGIRDLKGSLTEIYRLQFAKVLQRSGIDYLYFGDHFYLPGEYWWDFDNDDLVRNWSRKTAVYTLQGESREYWDHLIPERAIAMAYFKAHPHSGGLDGSDCELMEAFAIVEEDAK